MIEFAFYVNIILFALGLLLIVMLPAQQKKHPVLFRVILLGYFLVVLQYNYDWIFLTQKFLIASAAISFFAWIRQPIPSTE